MFDHYVLESIVNSDIFDSLRPLNDHSNGNKKAFCITLSTSAAIAEELRRVYVEHPKAISNLGIATLNFDTETPSNLPHFESPVNNPDSQFKRPLSHCATDPSPSTQKEPSLLVNLLRQPSMPHSSTVPIQQQQQQPPTPIKQNPYGNTPSQTPQQYQQHGYPMPQQPATSYPNPPGRPPENFTPYQVQQRMEHVNQQPIQHPPQYHQQNPMYQQHQQPIMQPTDHTQQIRQLPQMQVQHQVPPQIVKEVSQQSTPIKGKKRKQPTKKQQAQALKEMQSQQMQQLNPPPHLQNPAVAHRPPAPPQYHPGAGMHMDPYGNQQHPPQYHPSQQHHPGGIQTQILQQQHHPEYYGMQSNQHTQRIQQQMRSPYSQQFRPGMGPPPPQYGSIEGYAGQRQIHPPPTPGSHPHMWQNVQRPQMGPSQHLQQPANIQDSQRQFVHQQSYMQQMSGPPTNAQTHTSPQYPNPTLLQGQQHSQGPSHYYINPHQSGSEQQQIAHQQQMAQQRMPPMTPGHSQQHMMRPQIHQQQSQNLNLQNVQSQLHHDDSFSGTIVGDDSLEEVDLDSIEPMRNLGTASNTSSNSSLQNSHFMGQTPHPQQNSYPIQQPQHTTPPSTSGGGSYYGTSQYVNQNPMTNGPMPQQLGYPKGTAHPMQNSFYHQQSPQTSTSVSVHGGGTISSPSPARTPATPRSQISTPIANKAPTGIPLEGGPQTKEDVERERQITCTINSVIEKAMIDTPSSCSTPSTSTPQPQVMNTTSSSQIVGNSSNGLNGGKQNTPHHHQQQQQQTFFTSPINYSSPAPSQQQPMLNGSSEYHVTPPSHMNGSFEFDQGQVSQPMPYYNGNYSKIQQHLSGEVTHGMMAQQQSPYPSSNQQQQITPRRKRKNEGPQSKDNSNLMTPRKGPAQVPQHDEVFGSPQQFNNIMNPQQQPIANQIPASSTM
uniref:PAX-interacting protein 1 n=1 Tax=Parastrongyloides trichosuri TaxID=131310 RepID=A0A0N4Z2R4_PARTI